MTISEEERNILSQIAIDQESGNHLLYPRSEEYKKLYNELGKALDSEACKWTERDMALIREYRKMFPRY